MGRNYGRNWKGNGGHIKEGGLDSRGMRNGMWKHGAGDAVHLRSGPTARCCILTHIVVVVGMMMGMFTMLILVMAQLGAFVGDMDAEVVSMLRWIGKMTCYGIGTCTCAVTMLGTIS